MSLVPQLTCCVTLGKSPTISGPWFSHPEHEGVGLRDA